MTCTGARVCQNCSLGYFLREDLFCYPTCPDRFYADDSSRTCKPCPYDCLNCIPDGKCLTCDQANDHRVRNDSTGRCIALSGFYDGNQTVCLLCPSVCTVCSSATVCSACAGGYYLRGDGYCHSNCTDRFYPEPSTLQCTACPYDCLTCDRFSVCLSCDAAVDRRVLNSSGRCIPLDGYYDNLTSISVKCPPVCSTCSSATICSSCAEGYALRLDQFCYTSCLDSFYIDNMRTCQACPQSCLQCSSPVYCTSCKEGYFLNLLHLCLNSCHTHYFGNQTTHLCDPCLYECLTCTDNLTCLTCNSSDYRWLNQTSKRCQPLEGYFDNGHDSLCFQCPT